MISTEATDPQKKGVLGSGDPMQELAIAAHRAFHSAGDLANGISLFEQLDSHSKQAWARVVESVLERTTLDVAAKLIREEAAHMKAKAELARLREELAIAHGVIATQANALMKRREELSNTPIGLAAAKPPEAPFYWEDQDAHWELYELRKVLVADIDQTTSGTHFLWRSLEHPDECGKSDSLARAKRHAEAAVTPVEDLPKVSRD